MKAATPRRRSVDDSFIEVNFIDYLAFFFAGVSLAFAFFADFALSFFAFVLATAGIALFLPSTTVALMISAALPGFASFDFGFLFGNITILSTISIPSTTCPKTEYCPSRKELYWCIRKN